MSTLINFVLLRRRIIYNTHKPLQYSTFIYGFFRKMLENSVMKEKNKKHHYSQLFTN